MLHSLRSFRGTAIKRAAPWHGVSAIKKFIKIYDDASFVAILWVLSPLIPILFMANSKTWVPECIGFALFVFLGWYTGLIREQKLEQGLWKISDIAVYYIVPTMLFTFIFFAIYTSK